jgi:hypothetical protein
MIFVPQLSLCGYDKPETRIEDACVTYQSIPSRRGSQFAVAGIVASARATGSGGSSRALGPVLARDGWC